MAATRRRTDREREMRELFALRDAEGLTMRELAAASEVPAGTLSWWAAELRRRDRAAAAAPHFVELVVGSSDGEQRGEDADPTLCFEIALTGGVRVLVPVCYGLARLVRDLSSC